MICSLFAIILHSLLRRTFSSQMVRGCFVGSGSEGLQQPEIVSKIIELTKKADPAEIKVAYVGTATYDLETPKTNQTGKLAEAGCIITSVMLSRDNNDDAAMSTAVNEADVVIISGGNTLYAMDMWKHTKLDVLLKAAADRGCVLAGGSAGAICWFDAGHSDSADPDTYKEAMIKEYSAAPDDAPKDESTSLAEGEEAKPWKYIRVGCLAFLPGLVCPHADKVQSNGVLRVTDFDEMLVRHKGERGICIDHFAALCVDGDDYHVLSLPDRPGSVLENGEFSMAREGKPGCWVKDVSAEGKIVTELVPETGKIADLTKAAEAIADDAACDQCRLENPI